MSLRRRRRAPFALLWVTLLGITTLLTATPAGADPPGPTDYRTEITAVEPASSAFTTEIVGGDSFVLLEQLEPVVIEIVGYNGEPYLRFDAEGVIERNRRSPATYLNDDRFGDATTADLPDDVDPDAEPEWEVVATGGRYAWHDHRAHWMLASRPLGLAPGDQILEGVIPLRVDGSDVDITVESYWMPAPSSAPAIGGLLLAALAAGALWRSPRSSTTALVAGLASVAAGVVGIVQFTSLPAETGPSPTLWALPLVGLVAAVAAWFTRSRPQTALPLLFGGSVAVVVIGVIRIESIARAILPTELPFALDRLLTVFSLGAAAATVVVTSIALGRLLAPTPTAVAVGAAGE